jgi:hypothetical protein
MLLQLTLQVPLISAMDQQLLDVICEHMTYFLCTESTYIICEVDPVKVMLFIVRGKLESSTTDVGRIDFFNSVNLKLGDFYGEELLAAEHLEGGNRKKKMGGSRSRRDLDVNASSAAMPLPAATPRPKTHRASAIHCLCVPSTASSRCHARRVLSMGSL